MRKCRRCGEYIDIEMFRVHSTTKRPVQTCRICENTENLKRYHGNPSTRTSHRQASRRYILKKYGLSELDFDTLREQHAYVCGICGIHEEKTRFGTLNVDHCHEHNVVRGLLCHHCNAALGHLRDDPMLFFNAIKYMQERSPDWAVNSYAI